MARRVRRARLARPARAHRARMDRAASARAGRCWCSCTKAWARARCGATFRSGCATPPAAAAWSIRAPATAARRRARATSAGAWTSCTARRTRCCRRCCRRWASTGAPWLFGHSDGGSIALLYAARFPDAVAGAGRAGAAPLRRGRVGGQHRAHARGLRQHRPAAAPGAPPRRRGLGLLGLEPHLAATRRSAHWNIEAEIAAHPLPAAGHPGRGRRVRHARADPRHPAPRCRRRGCWNCPTAATRRTATSPNG